ncbi:flagellar filament capping protein FliD [Georgenia sp. AZ-5]|uniref:flagellar filament capping protein FliD n=1 Tax=Georgenia sp. AZ-5 TaxID=3367526 RepID=UPI003754CD7D
MGIQLTGLASGIDTAGLVDQLMQIESIPQLLLKNTVSATRTEIKALQDLNAKIAALATKAKASAAPDALDLFTVTSSSDAVSATASSGAAPGSLDLVVDSVAKAQVSVTAAMSATPSTTFTITTAAGATEVTAASTSLDDVAKALNDAGAGVRAAKVAAGTDPNTGEQLYRLQVSSTETGAKAAFSLHAGTADEVQAGTATDVFAEAGAAHVTTAKDAQVTLWAGTDAKQIITSSTNTFAGLLPGVDVTVAKASVDPVTITVSEDTAAKSTAAKDLVTALSDIFSYIDARTKVTTGTNGKTTAGVLTGEAVVRDAKQALLSAATAPIGGRSPSEAGITITRDGTVTFDAAKFEKALAGDPTFAQEVFATIAGRVQTAAESLSDKYDGRLTNSIKNREASAKNVDDEIASWDRRLALRRTTLEATWANLEVQMAAMQSQQQWLSGQLAGLTASILPSTK